jgi:hypothetical protein
MASNRTRSVVLLVVGVIVGLVLAVGLRGGEVRAQNSSAECGQWEVMAEVDQVSLNGTRPDYGKPVVRKITAGWEPFAVGQAGLVMNRRCAR